jgi:hypothetical protein
MKKLLWLSLLFCGGCFSFIPEGKAPQGEIVYQNNAERPSQTVKGAEERLITALTMIAMTEIPGEAVTLKAPEKMLAMLKNVLKGAGVRLIGSTARFTFNARNTGGEVWCFSLVDNLTQKILWQDEFRIVEKNAD